VLLPPLLALSIVLWLRVLIYPISRRPLYRQTFNLANIVVGALVVTLVLRAGAVVAGSGFTPAAALTVIIAAAAYFVAQAVNVGLVIVLSTPRPNL
jgi:hypothetical protein